ncbi:MAG TPA: hypothetical protein VM219_09940 [Phycisphaerae bacterium]|nr:hypothetical protein [Phycisphaerae bacterium]
MRTRLAQNGWMLPVCLGLLCASVASAATNVAVFNFQMTSDSLDWRWLEKGLADRIATDFVQAQGLSVIARDEMQLVAQKMNWVPEMATTDAARMGEIQKALKIEQLISGVYAVADDRIRITGQIVDVESRMELARREVEGPVEQVLDLQRRLSAELLAWFTKKEPAKILETLPVWTRSLPAAKALYEGMDLYDQGRYGEGWLRFRQASRDDPAYVEAVYWVGKMYYFMNRYEHARRSLERFVYMDMAHPRLGDAMVEYVHTYENSADVSPDALLRLYEDFGRRFPNAEVHVGEDWTYYGTIEADEWFKYKSAQLLGQIGRHKEAALMTRPAMDGKGAPNWGYGSGAPFCLLNVLQHHALTGETFEPRTLAGKKWTMCSEPVLSFAADARPLVQSLTEPTRILGEERRNLDKQALFDQGWVLIPMILAAPGGYVFESVRFYAIAEGGDDGRMEVVVSLPGASGTSIIYRYLDRYLEPAISEDLSVACREGVLWKNTPRTGLLIVNCGISVKSPQSDPIVVTGVRVEPTLKRIADPGAIDVQCQDSCRFRVDVDGALGRWLPGLVGPLAPGEHTVRLSPVEGGTPYGDWETKVVVEAGKVTPVAGRLPWQAASPWSSWKTAWVGRDYPGYDLYPHKRSSAPAMQADEGAVRLVWAHRGDLWSSASTDSERFSPPKRLDLPVSSGWNETSPALMRDESGRFLLTFLSIRDARHRSLPYLCWSRDFVHWSAPALVFDETVTNYSVIQDRRGRLVWVTAEEKGGARIRVSPDGYRWEQAACLTPPHQDGIVRNVEVFELEDGRLEIYLVETVYDKAWLPQWYVLRYVARDAETWSEPETLAEFAPPDRTEGDECTLHVARGETGPIVLAQLYKLPGIGCRTVVLEQDQAGAWCKRPETRSLMSGPYSFTFQPGLGYLIAWTSGEGQRWWPHPNYGPYVLCGSSLDPLRRPQAELPMPKEPERPPNNSPVSIIEMGSDGSITESYISAEPEGYEEVKPPEPAAGAPVGTLAYAPAQSLNFDVAYRPIQVDGSQNFRKPASGSGTVNPNALVFTAKRPHITLAFALDSEKPDSQHFDVLRIDTTGKGDFHDAAVVRRTGLSGAGGKEFSYNFGWEDVPLTFGTRKVPARVWASYIEDESQYVYVRIGTCAVGRCRFGEKVYEIHLYDGTCNLRVDDATKPLFTGGARLAEAGVGDSIYVDIGNGAEEYAAQAFYGHPILVDGRWWTVKVTEDGTKVSAEPYDSPTGFVRIHHPFWRAWLADEKSLLVLQGGPEPVPVPVGRYTMNRYIEWPADQDKGAFQVSLSAQSLRGTQVLNIAAGQTQEVVIGSPLKAVVGARRNGDNILFDVNFADMAGRTPLYRQGPHGNWNPEAVLTLYDSSGKAVGRVTRKLGSLYNEGWKIPYGLRGTFRASMECPSDPFVVEYEPATFTIE